MKFQQWLAPFHLDWKTTKKCKWTSKIFPGMLTYVLFLKIVRKPFACMVILHSISYRKFCSLSCIIAMVHQIHWLWNSCRRIFCRIAPLDTLLHAIFECESNTAAAGAMLRAAHCYSPALSPAGLLRLEVEAQDPFALPTVVIVATGIELIWSNRQKSAVTSLAAMRAELEARAGLFRQARGRRLREAGAIIANILNITM